MLIISQLVKRQEKEMQFMTKIKIYCYFIEVMELIYYVFVIYYSDFFSDS